MRIDAYFTPAELVGSELPARVVVVDALRATSTMVEALANGARAILPVETADEAARIAQNIGRDSVLLCGERKAVAIDGFDLGNGPPEFTRDRVEDKTLVMTTTNGTRALLAVAERQGRGDEGGFETLVGAFLNLGAVAEEVTAEATGEVQDVAMVCAGREGRFALEDALVVGTLIRRMEALGAEPVLNDAAAAARSLAGGREGLEGRLGGTAAGRRLLDLGRGEDVAHCAAVDRHALVPRLRGRKITVE